MSKFDSIDCLDYAEVNNPKGKYIDLSKVPLDLWDDILRMIKERKLDCLFCLSEESIKWCIKNKKELLK